MIRIIIRFRVYIIVLVMVRVKVLIRVIVWGYNQEKGLGLYHNHS